jgi:hypothetical protein
MQHLFEFSVEQAEQDCPVLQLVAKRYPAPEQMMAQLSGWLRQAAAFEQIQAEQGADWVNIRFHYQQQPFCLHYEHYSESCWIDADSQVSLVLLSQLADFILSIECNHGLNQPSSAIEDQAQRQ